MAGPVPVFRVFADPHKIATALTSEGLKPEPDDRGNIWSDPSNLRGNPEYFFIATIDVTTGKLQFVGDVSNDVVYTGSSRFRSHVERLELVLRIYNQQTAAPAARAYRPIVQRLFEQLQLEMPSDLLDAIDKQQSASFDEAYGQVQLANQPHKPGWGFNLELAITPKLQIRGDSTSDGLPDSRNPAQAE